MSNAYDFERAKAEYRDFCESGTHDIQIFAQPWYLDAVCGSPNDWRVILCKENERIMAAFPFVYQKGKYGLWHIRNPWQAPRLGIWIDYTGKHRKPGAREAYENRIVSDILSKLPYYDEFQIAFDARFQNWQPFYRHGFQQTSHYSYVTVPTENFLETLSYNMRRETRLQQAQYQVEEQVSIEEYWTFFQKSYQQRGRVPSYSKEQFFSLWEAVLAHDSGSLLACRDQSGQIFATAGVLWDSRRMYNMFNTFDPGTKFSTLPLVTLHTIELARRKGLLFDFEGSMIPGVASYNMKFNSTQEPYFIITNYSDKYRLLNGLRETSRALKNLIKGKNSHDS